MTSGKDWRNFRTLEKEFGVLSGSLRAEKPHTKCRQKHTHTETDVQTRALAGRAEETCDSWIVECHKLFKKRRKR